VEELLIVFKLCFPDEYKTPHSFSGTCHHVHFAALKHTLAFRHSLFSFVDLLRKSKRPNQVGPSIPCWIHFYRNEIIQKFRVEKLLDSGCF
jgi:hypothetical protein